MELRAGYKKTEAGLIPEDWNINFLGNIASFANGKPHEQAISDRGNFIVVNSKFISTGGIVYKFSDKCLSPLRKMDITMVMSDIPNGKALAKCFLIHEDNQYTLNQRICSIRSDSVDNKFLIFLLNRNPFYLNFDGGVGQTNLKKADVLGCPLALPPTIKEQTAIANALSDVDALIGSLQKLIAKKRQIKQGAMQTLLDPYENGVLKAGWMLKKVSDFGQIVTGSTPPTQVKEYWNGSIPWVTPTDISIQRDMSSSERGITNSGLSVIRKLPANTLLVTCIASIGKNAILRTDGACNQQINAVIPNEENNVEFLYYLMEKNKLKLLNSAGITATLMISKKDFSDIEFFLPRLDVQKYIAEILSDMDAEITALESKLVKYQQIKQGMMQNLLTGRIRLV